MAKHMPADERKKMILEAAMMVFCEKGYNHSSIDDIAKEAGISKGGIYWHFKNKDDLVKSLFSFWLDAQLQEFQNASPGSATFLDTLLTMLTQPFDLPEENLKITRLMMEFYAHSAHIDGLIEIFNDYYKVVADELTKYIDHSIEQGELSKDLKHTHDISILIALIFDGLFARLYLDSLTKEKSFENHKESLKQLLTRWLKA